MRTPSHLLFLGLTALILVQNAPAQNRFVTVDNIVNQAISDSAFPGAVLLVIKDGKVVKHSAYGRETYNQHSPRVTKERIFDLASVTKVIGVTSAVMKLVGDGEMSLDRKVTDFFPAFAQQGKGNITIRNLLVHNSGLPAWRKFYEFCSTPECVMDSIMATPLVYKTGDSTLYSDLGLIVTGKIVEQITGMPLNTYLSTTFFKPLGMKSTLYNPPKSLWKNIMPTEIDTVWRKTSNPVRGTVHDENAWVLGGVSGHAGLFSTAQDLGVFMQMLLNEGVYKGKRYLSAEVIRMFTKQQSPRSSRGIGWDTNAGDDRWTGTRLSKRAFIHTGFTGTSVVADPESNLIIVFLTNRVYPFRSHLKIAGVRPRLHDAIAEAVIKAEEKQ